MPLFTIVDIRASFVVPSKWWRSIATGSLSSHSAHFNVDLKS